MKITVNIIDALLAEQNDVRESYHPSTMVRPEEQDAFARGMREGRELFANALLQTLRAPELIVKSIEVEERTIDYRNQQRVRSSRRNLHRRTIVYVSHEKESVLENFGNRAARPYTLYKEVFGEQVARLLGVTVKDIRWSQTAGCSCGCSPGFVVSGSTGKDVWVTIAADTPKTTDPELAENRVSQLLSDPTMTKKEENEYIPGTTIPKPTVALVGTDGNAFAVIGMVRRALKKAGAPSDVVEAFVTKATSGDYDNVLVTATQYVNAE